MARDVVLSEVGADRREVWEVSKAGGETVVFLHGAGLSSGSVWSNVLAELPECWHGVALTLRDFSGVGGRVPVDATRGMKDYCEDVLGVLCELGVERFHLIAHSAGALMAWEFMRSWPDRLSSVAVINPSSPFGIGGTCDAIGT